MSAHVLGDVHELISPAMQHGAPLRAFPQCRDGSSLLARPGKVRGAAVDDEQTFAARALGRHQVRTAAQMAHVVRLKQERTGSGFQ